MTIPLLSTILLALLLVVQPVRIVRAEDVGGPGQSQIVVTKAAVATDNGVCSEAGRDIMQNGGNAIDAAVTVALCQGVVSQGCSGLGGGGFMIVRLANGTTTAFNMREQAPGAATAHMFDDDPEKKVSGALSIGIPGELAGLHAAWTKYKSGHFNWSALFQPAIKFARDGFNITPYVYSQFLVNPSAMFNQTGLCQVYTKFNKTECDKLNGKPIDNIDSYIKYFIQVNETTKNPMLATTLETIANEGPSVFYGGSIGAQIVSEIQKGGGIITLDDLREFTVIEREPLINEVFQTVQDKLEVMNVYPPSSGGVCFVLLLNVLKYLGIPQNLTGPPGRNLYVEALKHAFAIRENLGDPDFSPNVNKVVAEMLDEKFAKAIARNITNNHGPTYSDPRLYGSRWAPIPDDGTLHFTIMDADKNAVSITVSVNFHFGSLILSPSTGIVFNNVMDDFSTYNNSGGLLPDPANTIAPKKRPLSSMNPTIVLQNGTLKALLGASGGPLIIPATTRVFLNYFGMGMNDPLDCVKFARVYHKLYPNIVYYENLTTPLDTHIQVNEQTIDYLRYKGHDVDQWVGENSQCQIIVQQTQDKIYAVSDPRKGGFPAGYN